MAPPYCNEPWNSANSSTAIYYFIQVFTFLIAIVYIFYKALRDNKQYIDIMK
jgi:hypothetical protein